MKKTFFCMAGALLAAAMFIAPAEAAQADAVARGANPAGNPIDQLTGKIWQNSQESNKEAILFGIDLGVAANYFANQKAQENAGKKGKNRAPSQLSWFDRCWIKAFANVSRKEAVKMVDDWYAAHPAELDRPVMSVLWHDVVVPALEKNDDLVKEKQ